MGLAGTAFLFLLGKPRVAFAFAVVGAVVGIVAVTGDYTLGEVVGRTRPLADKPVPSFPSGHVFGSTVFFGFSSFLAVQYRLEKKILVPFLAVMALLILAVGPARIYEQAHWPSDVAAGYLLGALWLLILIPSFLYFRRRIWAESSHLTEAHSAAIFQIPEEKGRRVERSIGSVVVLDPQEGTARKTYRPPRLVRLLYWLSFQASFPYDSNPAALQAASYRRTIAGLLTVHRFGKDLVAPATGVDCVNGEFQFVTEYVPGPKVENDQATKQFLGQVAETFVEAGLSVWQINPLNPHAHTNLIRNSDGDLKIIDLESAVVTPFLGPGEWRSALRSGNFPVFDDIDFPRLRRYMSANVVALEGSLGPAGVLELTQAVDRCEAAIQCWKEGEPRIWGRFARRVYMLLNWKPFFQRVSGGLAGANQASLAYLNSGIGRWEGEGRLTPTEGEALRSRIGSVEARDALQHLGAHLVLTAIFRFPIGSIVRLGWTVAFWGVYQTRRFVRRGGEPARRASNVHSPLVMAISIIPGFGALAYVAARPLRHKLLVRLVLDQIATKLPFKIYRRLHFGQWLARSPMSDQLRSPGTLSSNTRELASMPPLKLPNAAPNGCEESGRDTPVTSWSGRDRLPAH